MHGDIQFFNFYHPFSALSNRHTSETSGRFIKFHLDLYTNVGSVLHVIITKLSGGTVDQVSAVCLFVVTCTLNGFFQQT